MEAICIDANSFEKYDDMLVIILDFLRDTCLKVLCTILPKPSKI